VPGWLKLVGLAASEVRAWAAAAQRQLSLPSRAGLDGSALWQDGSDEEAAEEGGDAADAGGASGPSLLSASEAAGLAALLEAYRLDVGDCAQLEDNLRREAQALEASNVTALLESESELSRVTRLLGTAQAQLGELGDWLGVFSVKLVTMRADIAVIEARSNRLDRQSRNNDAVQRPLEDLLARIAMPPGLERSLASDDPRVGMRAAAQLSAAAAALQPGALPPAFAAMRCVREQAAALARMRADWCSRTLSALRRALSDALDAAPQSGARAREGGGAPRGHDPSGGREAMRSLQPLIQALIGLDASAADALREAHARAAGTALRRAMRDLAASARLYAKEEGAKGGSPHARSFAAVAVEGTKLALGELLFLAELHGGGSGEKGGKS
jgi:hypothetical protein